MTGSNATASPKAPAYSVILSGCSAPDLHVSLRALESVEGERPEILCAADAPWQDPLLRDYAPWVILCRGPAWPLARADWVMLLGQGDCLAPDYWRQAKSRIDADPALALLGGGSFRTIDRLGEICDHRCDPGRYLQFPGSAATVLPALAGLLLHRARLDAAGGAALAPTTLLGLGDMAFRLMDDGWTSLVSEDLDSLAGPSADLDIDPRQEQQIDLFLDRHGDVAFTPLQVAAQRDVLHRRLARERALRGLHAAPISQVAGVPAGPPALFPYRQPPARKLHIAYFCQWDNPVPCNGIERVVRQLARGMAARGHLVSLFALGKSVTAHRRFEDGVWIYRQPVLSFDLPPDLAIPPLFWCQSMSRTQPMLALSRRMPIDLLQAPNWDAEGIAAIREHRLPTLVALYTPFKAWLPLNQDKFTGDEMLLIEAERRCYIEADGVLACGHAILEEIEQQYDLRFDRDRVHILPHGLEDKVISVMREPRSPDEIRLLTVGRLEWRKGIDLVLALLPALCRDYPALRVSIVGDDSIIDQGGVCHRRDFEASADGGALAGRVQFAGQVDEAALWQHYADCDILLAPSRFESFGLTLIEAMMFGRPVIASAVGGMREIITDGVDGLLVPSGDKEALRHALDRLLRDQALRQRIGQAGRQTYLARYSLERMIAGAEACYSQALSPVTPAADPQCPATDS